MATGQLFSRTTQALFYNYKQLPIQRMLDFDFLCGVYHQLYHIKFLLFFQTDSSKFVCYINVFLILMEDPIFYSQVEKHRQLLE